MPLIAGKRMNSVGGFTLVRPIEIGVRDSSWVAEGDGGVTRVVDLCERFDATEASGAALGQFFGRGVFQKRIAEATGDGPGGLGLGHAVAVRTLLSTPWGGLLARDPYDISASELISGKTRLRGDALQEIVSGVVTALGLYAGSGHRRHGDLVPSAVLIAGDRAGRLRVGLHCPADSDSYSAIVNPAADEMERLGRLIFELVLHRPFRAMGGYPVREGPEWDSLGKSGGFWLGLVNELLEPRGCSLSLEEVAARVRGLRFRADGPGLGVYAARGAVAAAVLAVVAGGVFFVVRPRPQPVLKEFKDAEFVRWLRVTPVVASLREAVTNMPDAPAAVVSAMGALTVTAEDRDSLRVGDSFTDFFDVPRVFSESKLGFERAMDDPLPDLIEQMGIFVQSDLDSRLGEEAGEPAKNSDQFRIERFAGLYEEGLARFTGDEQRPGVLGALSAESWSARGLLEGIGSGDGLGWLHESAHRLYSEPLGTVGVLLDSFGSGVDGSVDLGSMTAKAPLAGGRVGDVDRFLAAAVEIETAAGLVGAWRDDLYPKIESDSVKIAAAAGWPAVPDSVRALIPGDRDPLLASFAKVPEWVGVVADEEGAVDLNTRLETTAAVVEEIAGFIDASWDAGGVDLIALSGWTERARDELLAVPSGDDAGELAGWIDARIGLGASWLDAARSAGVVAEADWPASGIDGAIAETRRLWNAATEANAEQAAEAEARYLGRAGIVASVLESVDEGLIGLRALPRWESLRSEAVASKESIESSYSSIAVAVENIHAEVMKLPRDTIRIWRDATPDFGAGVVADGLRGVRDRLGKRVIGDWETWAADSGLDEDAQRSTPETVALRNGLSGIDDVLGRVMGRVDAIAGGEHAFGGFDGAPIRDRVRALAMESFDRVLSDDGPWGDRASYIEGGAFDGMLDGVQSAWEESLAELSGDLGVLAETGVGISRGYVAGESYGAGRVAESADLRTLVGRLRGDESGPIEGVADVEEILLAAEELLSIGKSNETDRLVGAFVDDSGSRPGIAVAALRRLDEVAGAGTPWPASVGDLDRDRIVLKRGLLELRESLSEEDWARVVSDDEPASLRRVVKAWWLRGVGLAGSPASFASAVGGASVWFDGIDGEWDGLLGEGLLSGRSRYNARAIRIRGEIGRLASDAIVAGKGKSAQEIQRLDAELRSGVEARLAELDRAVGEDLDDASAREARRWMDGLLDVLRKAEGGRAGWDPAAFGPVGAEGFTGWTHRLDDSVEPAVLTYTSGDGSQRVVFELVALPNGEQVFLGVDEVSVALCGDILQERGSTFGERSLEVWYEKIGNNYAGNLVEGPSTRNVFLRGPKASQYRLRSPETWLAGVEYGPADPAAKTYPAYPDGLRGNGFNEISPSQGEPDPTHPVNYIRGTLAAEIAQAFGCRLPTEVEFRAALGRVPGVRSGRWNLRDSTFLAQRANFEAASSFGVSHYEPGKWSYDGTDGANTQDWGIGAGGDDKLWFYKTGDAGGADSLFQQAIRFRHLIGNVAEFVLTTDSASSLSGIRVMGASALSDPSVQPDSAMPADIGAGTRNGFVDVGFRLAIDADDFGSLGKLVEKEIEQTSGVAFVSGERE